MVKKKRNYTVWMIGALILAGGSAYYYGQSAEPVEAVQATEVAAEKGDLVIGFESDGKSTLPFSNLDFEVSGKLLSLNVVAGDILKAGQVVAAIDAKDYQRTYDSAKITYDKAVINYNVKVESVKQSLVTEADKVLGLKQSLEQLKNDYNTMLLLKESYTQSELDLKKQSIEDAQRAFTLANNTYEANKKSTATIELEKMNVASAKMQLDIAAENLAKTTLRASEGGTVLSVGSRVGDPVSPNNDSGSLSADSNHLVVYSDSKTYQVETSISEQDLPFVTMGQTVKVNFDALEGKVYEGKVVEIDELPTTDSSGIVSYGVVAELSSGFEEISIGMTATVNFIQMEALNMIIVPNKAVTMESGVQYVNVKLSDGSLEKRAVKAGLTDGRNVAISSGLSEGEIVVIAPVVKAE